MISKVNIKLASFFFLFFIPLASSHEITLDDLDPNTSLVIAEQNGIRMGDCLMAYTIARWLAHNHNLPFCCRPFPYSNRLMIPELDDYIEKIPDNFFSTDIRGPDYWKLFASELNKNNTLYRIGNKPVSLDQYRKMKSDSIFIESLRKRIAPRKNLDLIFPPKNIISIAIHVRKGGGFDPSLLSKQLFTLGQNNKKVDLKRGRHADIRWPHKFPPEQYYVDQLIRLSKYFNHEPMYVHIFTDHKRPVELTKRIEQAISLNNITYNCRKKDNRHDKNVLIDFFSMMNFDCLIRPKNSTYSHMIDIVGNFKISIFPLDHHWEQDEQGNKYLIMDDIHFEENLNVL